MRACVRACVHYCGTGSDGVLVHSVGGQLQQRESEGKGAELPRR